jgi:L-rhamnose-H+ transport protein
VGLSSVLGTILPPLVRGEFASILSRTGSGWVLGGVALGTVGILLCGLSGRMKEIDLAGGQGQAGFSFAKGIPLCLLAGVLSAVYGFALESGEPIAAVAEAHGAEYWRGNVVYIFANSGAFLSTCLYCLYLGVREKTLGELVRIPRGDGARIFLVNVLLSVLTGVLWYGQFFFYNLGHVRMGEFKFTSWAIHMIMLVLISNALGLTLREWRGCRSRTLAIVAVSLTVLITAVLMLTYGNHLAEALPP